MRGSRHRVIKFLSVGCFSAVAITVSGVASARWDIPLAVAFLAVCLFRLYSLIRAVAWIWARGAEYKQALDSADVDTRTALADPARELDTLHALYMRDDVRGDFFPFGVRGVVLDVWSQRRSSLLPKRIRRVIYFSWKFYAFAPAFAVVTVVVTYNAARHSMGLPARTLYLLAALAVVIGSLSIAAEAALSYLTFGSWSLGYHRFDVQPERSVTEISVFVGGGIAAFVSIAASACYVSVAFDGYQSIPKSDRAWGGIGRAIYYTFTSLTANGDANPMTAPAFLLTALTYLVSVSYLVIVVSLLLDSVSEDFSRKFASRRTGSSPNPADPNA